MTRSAGPLPLSAPLPGMLAALRAAKGIVAPPEALVSSVQATEKALRGEIPNDLLGYWLAAGLSLDSLIDITHGAVSLYYEANEQRNWRKLTKFDHVAFDDGYSQDDGPLVAKLGNGKPANIVCWFLRKGESLEPSFAKPEEPAVVSYLKWKYPDVDFSVEAAPVEVRLIVAQKQTVVHPKFGAGVVLQQIPPDKVEIDFGSSGVKKLLKGPWFEPV